MSPEQHRTFLAAYPDRPTLERVEEWISTFRERYPGIRWSPESQLHFTLRFFGNLDDSALATASRVLEAEAPLLRPLAFPLNGLGAFPDWRRPRVLWIGAGAGGEELEELARRLDLKFAAAGLGRADKPFRAHLTIGRVREGDALEKAVAERMRKEAVATPPFTVSDLHLMLSRLGRDGAQHELYRAVRLGSVPRA